MKNVWFSLLFLLVMPLVSADLFVGEFPSLASGSERVWFGVKVANLSGTIIKVPEETSNVLYPDGHPLEDLINASIDIEVIKGNNRVLLHANMFVRPQDVGHFNINLSHEGLFLFNNGYKPNITWTYSTTSEDDLREYFDGESIILIPQKTYSSFATTTVPKNIAKLVSNDEIFIDPTLSACGALTSAGKYTLDRDLSDDDGNCLEIDASGVAIDCAGYNINFSLTGSGNAINANAGADYINISNCNFIMGNNSNDGQSTAIQFITTGATNIIIRNNNFFMYNRTNGTARCFGQFNEDVDNLKIINNTVVCKTNTQSSLNWGSSAITTSTGFLVENNTFIKGYVTVGNTSGARFENNVFNQTNLRFTLGQSAAKTNITNNLFITDDGGNYSSIITTSKTGVGIDIINNIYLGLNSSNPFHSFIRFNPAANGNFTGINIYNNTINTSGNILLYAGNPANWNLTTYGNYYFNSTGGYSIDCAVTITDYICDNNLSLGENSTDFFPRSMNTKSGGVNNYTQFLKIPNNQTIEFGQHFNATFDGNASNMPITWSINWTTNFSINQTGYLNSTNVLVPGFYEINVSINGTDNLRNSTIFTLNVSDTQAPTCRLQNMTPATFNDSMSGTLNVVFNCTDPSGINVSFDAGQNHYWAFVTRTLGGYVTPGLPNRWSVRWPANGNASLDDLNPTYGRILRAFGRGYNRWYETLGYNQTFNNDTFSYAANDGHTGRVVIYADGITNAIINYTGVVDMVYRQNIPVDYEEMVHQQKYNYSVSSTTSLLIERLDYESVRNSDNYTVNVFKDISVYGIVNPSNLRSWYCNSSYVPTGGVAVASSPNCVLINSVPSTTFTTAYFSDSNSSYDRATYGVALSKIGTVKTTPTYYYFYDTLTVAANRGYNFRFMNGSTGTNVSYDNSSTMWACNKAGTTCTAMKGTADIFVTSTKKVNDESQWGLYVKDLLNNALMNVTVFANAITLTDHPITSPGFIALNSTYDQNDYLIIGNHSGIMGIKIGTAVDPDGGPINHNVTLCNEDGSYNYTINASFNATGEDVWLYFNTSLVGSGQYKLNVTAFDPTIPTWKPSTLRGNNFTIDNVPPNFTGIPGTLTVYYNEAFSVLFNASDDWTPPVGWQINWTTDFVINQTGTLTNLTIVGAGNYSINVSINDTMNNRNFTIFNITVLPVGKPITITNTAGWTVEYGTGLDITCVSNDDPVILFLNGTNITNPYTTNLSAGTYNVSCNSTATQNFTFNESSVILTINKANGLVRAYINDTEYHFESTNGTNIWLNGTLITGQGEIYTTLNGSEINRGPSPLSNLTNLTEGYYNFTAWYDGNQNYTSDAEYWFINITHQIIFPYFTSIPANTVIVYGQGFLASFNATGSELPLYWYINDTTLFVINQTGNLTNLTLLPAGTYHLNISINDTINQQNSTFYNVTVDKANASINMSINQVTANITMYANSTVVINASIFNGTGLLELFNDTGFMVANTSLGINLSLNDTGVYNFTTVLNASQNYTATNLTLSITVIAFNTNTTPYYYGISSSHASPVTYSQTNYTFSIFWNDTSQAIDQVWFEIGGINLTGTNISVIDKNYSINISSLKAGTHNYKWFANNTLGNLNGTNVQVFTVNKADGYLGITVAPSVNEVYNTTTTVTGTGCPDQAVCELKHNDTVVTSPDITNLSAGKHGYNYSTDGNENYTGYVVNETITISKLAPYMNMSFDPGTDVSYRQLLSVYFSTCHPQTECNFTVNGTDSEAIDVEYLGVGLYNFTYYTLGSENISAAQKDYLINVTKDAAILNLTLNDILGNITVNQSQNFILNASVLDGVGAIDLYNNSVYLITNYTIGLLLNFNEPGNYTFTAILNASQNFTRTEINRTVIVLNISDITPPAVFNITPYTGTTHYNNTIINITCNATDAGNISTHYINVTNNGIFLTSLNMTKNGTYFNTTYLLTQTGTTIFRFIFADNRTNYNTTETTSITVTTVGDTEGFIAAASIIGTILISLSIIIAGVL